VKRKPILVIVLLTVPSLIFGSVHQWHLIKAGNNANYWVGRRYSKCGRGDHGGAITATLFWNGSDTDVQITMKGSITTGDKLTVKETVTTRTTAVRIRHSNG
jgi:hypothetical protein